MRIEIYGQPNCTYCKDAIALCQNHRLEFVYRDIAANPLDRQEMFQRAPTATTVPQIFINHRHIGGFTDLKARLDDGTLQQFIAGS